MIDERIGQYGANGEIVVRPTKTLSGQPAQRPYAAVTKLDATHFVVHSTFVPKGYDVEAAIKRLKRKLETGSEEEVVVSVIEGGGRRGRLESKNDEQPTPPVSG